MPGWLKSSVFYRAELAEVYKSEDVNIGAAQEVHPYDANLVSSEKINGKHNLLLDLDQPVYFTGSTSNHHLYISADLNYDALLEVTTVLAKHGIVQEGIKNQLERRGHLCLRPPGNSKHDSINNLNLEDAKKALTLPFSDGQIEIKDSFAYPKPNIAEGLESIYKQIYKTWKKEKVQFPLPKGFIDESVAGILNQVLGNVTCMIQTDFPKDLTRLSVEGITIGYIQHEYNLGSNMLVLDNSWTNEPVPHNFPLDWETIKERAKKYF